MIILFTRGRPANSRSLANPLGPHTNIWKQKVSTNTNWEHFQNQPSIPPPHAVVLSMWFQIPNITILHVHTWPERARSASDVAGIIKNHNVWLSDFRVRLTASTCVFEDPIATKAKTHFDCYDLSPNTPGHRTGTLKSLWKRRRNCSLKSCAWLWSLYQRFLCPARHAV